LAPTAVRLGPWFSVALSVIALRLIWPGLLHCDHPQIIWIPQKLLANGPSVLSRSLANCWLASRLRPPAQNVIPLHPVPSLTLRILAGLSVAELIEIPVGAVIM
jgi:hypothetical protein